MIRALGNLLHLLGVVHDGADFGLVANDALILAQALDIYVGEIRDGSHVKLLEGSQEAIPFTHDDLAAQTTHENNGGHHFQISRISIRALRRCYI